VNHKILLPALIAFFISGQFVYSQAPAGGAAGTAGPAGGGIPPPIIIPKEDLDLFENSRLNGQSTLTPKIIRKSNVEVNAEIERSREERNNALEEEKTTVQTVQLMTQLISVLVVHLLYSDGRIKTAFCM